MSTQPKAPQFARPVTFCGADVEGSTCHRLPMHSGDHRPFVRGNGVPQPKADSKRATKPGDKLVTRAGVKYTEKRRSDGSIVLTPTKAEPVAPTAASESPTGRAKVRTLPMPKSRRRVASSTGR